MSITSNSRTICDVGSWQCQLPTGYHPFALQGLLVASWAPLPENPTKKLRLADGSVANCGRFGGLRWIGSPARSGSNAGRRSLESRDRFHSPRIRALRPCFTSHARQHRRSKGQAAASARGRSTEMATRFRSNTTAGGPPAGRRASRDGCSTIFDAQACENSFELACPNESQCRSAGIGREASSTATTSLPDRISFRRSGSSLPSRARS